MSYHQQIVGDTFWSILYRVRTTVDEEDGQEDEAVQGTKQDDAHVHAEIEDLEELWVRERQHDDATELCQRDSTQHLAQTTL